MADINSIAALRRQRAKRSSERDTSSSHSSRSSDRALIELVELLFFAYRDFTGEPDAILAELGFGRAHHRVIHFVARRPGLRVADLLDILRITKQSLARVLKQLVDEGFIEARLGTTDRRERRLYPTTKGTSIADRLAGLQTARIASAIAAAGPDGELAARAFLTGMISPEDRKSVVQSILGRDDPEGVASPGGA